MSDPKAAPEPKAPKADKPVFTKPTSQLDLEARQKSGNAVAPLVASVNPAAPDDSGFIGTDAMYQNRANETDMPFDSDEGPDEVAEKAYAKSFEKAPVKKSDK